MLRNLRTDFRFKSIFTYIQNLFYPWGRSLVVSDLRSETKRFPARVRLPAMCRGELRLSACEAGGSGREELNRYPPPSAAVPWIVNVRERKPRQKKYIYIQNPDIFKSSTVFRFLSDISSCLWKIVPGCNYFCRTLLHFRCLAGF